MKLSFFWLMYLIFPLIVTAQVTAVHADPGGEANVNIKKVLTYWEEVWNKGNLQAVEDFYHPDAIHGKNFSIEKFQKSVEYQRSVFPDFNVTIDEIFAKDNKVICRVTYRGTHTGRKFFGQEPLNKAVEVQGMDIFTFKSGKCAEHQHVADHLDLVLQMGLKLTPTEPDK